MRIELEVNGHAHVVDVEARESLADILRDRIGLTGTHVACEQGACGACTVRVEGVAVQSCLMLGVQADGRRVQTIEGVAGPDGMHPVQRALAEHHGLQCGFCTPGIVLAALDVLEASPSPTRADVEAGLSGNLCRCTGYAGIVDAVLAAGQAGPNGGAGR